MVRVQTVIDSWRTVRQDTAQAVSDFPENALDETPLEGCMSFRQIARHILDVGHGFTGAMMAGVDNFAVPNRSELLAAHALPLPGDASITDLAEALLESVRERTAQLELEPEEFWRGEVTRFDGQKVTRLEMLQTLKEHELTHRAQLFTYLRMRGIVPVTTRRRLAAQQHAQQQRA